MYAHLAHCQYFLMKAFAIAGEVGIDDGLVISANEEVIEMMNGCLCCTGEESMTCAVRMCVYVSI
jgi:hypothetical protein